MPTDVARPHRPPRRSVLTGLAGLAGLLALPACTSDAASGGAASAPPAASPDAARPVVDRVVAAERELLDHYAATVARHPRLAARLEPLAAEHAAHLAALGAPGVPPVPTRVPPDRADAVATLAGLERAAAGARVDDALAAPSDLARLLAGIGAAEAAHAALLGP